MIRTYDVAKIILTKNKITDPELKNRIKSICFNIDNLITEDTVFETKVGDNNYIYLTVIYDKEKDIFIESGDIAKDILKNTDSVTLEMSSNNVIITFCIK